MPQGDMLRDPEVRIASLSRNESGCHGLCFDVSVLLAEAPACSVDPKYQQVRLGRLGVRIWDGNNSCNYLRGLLRTPRIGA